MKKILASLIAVAALAGCGYSYTAHPADHAGAKKHHCFVVTRRHEKFWSHTDETLGTFCLKGPSK